MMTQNSVATILERTAPSTIQDWYERVLLDGRLMAVPMSRELRCAHLPQLFRDLVFRLRFSAPPGSDVLLSSKDVTEHGAIRRKQGYSAAMMVEESRMLQVSIFKCLHDNRDCLDFNLLLPDVMTIADEVDAQLSRAVAEI
jgi:hypothetical protein